MDTTEAASLLAEIQSEPLQKLLTDISRENSPPGSTNIPGLDAHLFSTGSHHSSSQSSLNRGDVIEIQGPASSGKTHLLYHLILNCIMPETLGGWNKAAIIFDMDGAFRVSRLHQLLLSRLSKSSSESKEIAVRALGRVHIFRPTSSSQLATTLRHIPTYHHENLPGLDIGILSIDSISAFYWPDRFILEQIRSVPDSDKIVVNPLRHVLTALELLRVTYAPVILLNNWGLNPINSGTANSAPTLYKQHLHPFPSSDHASNSDTMNVRPHSVALTHQITLSFPPIPSFPMDTSLDEAKHQEKSYRKQVVAQGEVIGYIRTPGISRVGRFTFYIGDEGLLVGSGIEL